MTEPTEVEFEILFSSGESCDSCGKPIEDLRLIRFSLPARVEPYNMHQSCLEELGWRINYFTFHFTVDQSMPTGVN